MKHLSAAVLLYLGLATAALAQTTFPMPPPAGVTVVGVQVVTSCGSASLTPNTTAFLAMDATGKLCDGASGGGSSPGAGSQPYNYTPLSPGQYNLAITSSTSLTIPTGALQAVVCASGNNVNYTYDGTTTPTASVGLPLLTNQCVQFSGATILSNLKFIQSAATATLNVGYTK